MGPPEIDPYRVLGLSVIKRAIDDLDDKYFLSTDFEDLADLLGYNVDGMRELALRKIAEERRRKVEKRANRRRRPRRKNRNGAVGVERHIVMSERSGGQKS